LFGFNGMRGLGTNPIPAEVTDFASFPPLAQALPTVE